MLLIGSQAAKHLNILPRWRKTSDWDFVCDPAEFIMFLNACHNNHKKVVWNQSKKYPGKFHIVLDDKYRLEFDCTQNESRKYITENEGKFSAITIELPFAGGYKTNVSDTIMLWIHKRSHAHIALHSQKTIADLIHLTKYILISNPDNIVRDFLHYNEASLLDILTNEANERNNIRKKQKKINFNKDKDIFFKSSRKLRMYPHDDVHDITAFTPYKPLYRDNLKYADKALIDNDKFFARDLDYHIKMIQEEISVLSLERIWLNDRTLSQQYIYQTMMIQFITTMCKGRTQDFILDHIHLLTKPKWDYLQQFIDNEHKLEEIKE